jgi:hypothetical protein
LGKAADQTTTSAGFSPREAFHPAGGNMTDADGQPGAAMLAAQIALSSKHAIWSRGGAEGGDPVRGTQRCPTAAPARGPSTRQFDSGVHIGFAFV